jgi:DNA-binding GntR family transcriptional regulator
VSLRKLGERTLLTDRVFEAIRASIMNGDMPAGYRLRIRDLAAQVGTSVMPVREAIRRLEEAGLAERQPHRGAVVKGLTLRELVDVYDVRRLLEREAARLGTQRITAAGCERMQAEYDQMRSAITNRDVITYIERDESLLTALYDAGGNPVLVDLIVSLWQRCRGYKIVGAQAAVDAADPESLWRHQGALVTAAGRGDASTAVAATDASLLEASQRTKELLAAQEAAQRSAPEGADPGG